MSDAKCPECGTRGYLILPSYGNCKTCLALRMAYLDRCLTNDAAEKGKP